MKTKNSADVASQLRQAGADAKEAALLVEIAESLGHLDLVPVPAMHWHPHRPALRWMRTFGYAAALLVVGIVVTSLSQAANPGSPIYPLKRLTENVAVAIDPSYKGAVMMRRADEVKTLVDAHGSPHLIAATLASYNSELASYQNEQYADLEYCKNVLTQARSLAHGSSRTAITRALQQLDTRLNST